MVGILVKENGDMIVPTQEQELKCYINILKNYRFKDINNAKKYLIDEYDDLKLDDEIEIKDEKTLLEALDLTNSCKFFNDHKEEIEEYFGGELWSI